MQRTILGLVAVALLGGGTALCLLAYESAGAIGLGLIRLGIMFGVIWFAIPNVTVIFAKFPPWLIAVTVAGIVLAIIAPRQTLPIVIPLLILLWVIGPRWLSRKSNK